MVQTGHYALDRIENGLAILERLDGPANQAVFVTVPVRQLCAGDRRPADGTVFFCGEAGCWRPDPEKTNERQQLLRAKLRRLRRQPPNTAPAAPAEPTF